MSLISDQDKPLLQSPLTLEVQVHDGQPPILYASEIVRRAPTYDVLGALRAAKVRPLNALPGVAYSATVLYGYQEYFYRYPIELFFQQDEWRLHYVAPFVRQNRRAEVRSVIPLYGQFWIRQNHSPEIGPFDTVSRNISYSAIRFFTPKILKPQSVIRCVWQIPGQKQLDHTMQILRTMPAMTTWHNRDGWDAVGLWHPALPDAVAKSWRLLCDRNR